MQHEPQDFARGAGKPALGYCRQCKRNVVNSRCRPGPSRSWWIGPWVVEDVPCPNFKEMKEE